MIKVYMGIPSTGNRLDAQVIALRQIEARYKYRVELVYPKDCVRRIFHDYARNEIVKEFLASDCDVLWFLDSDILPAPHVLDLVTEHYDKWMVSGATYPVWMIDPMDDMPKVLFTAYEKTPEGKLVLAPVPGKGATFVDGLATGCMFIKRGLFALMKAPYFEFKYNAETRQLVEGEDLGFCLKVGEMGYKFFTDYSMVGGHYKTVNLLDVSNYAVEMSNYKVMAYEAEIRPKVEKLQAAYHMLRDKQTGKTGTGLIIPGRSKLVTP